MVPKDSCLLPFVHILIQSTPLPSGADLYRLPQDFMETATWYVWGYHRRRSAFCLAFSWVVLRGTPAAVFWGHSGKCSEEAPGTTSAVWVRPPEGRSPAPVEPSDNVTVVDIVTETLRESPRQNHPSELLSNPWLTEWPTCNKKCFSFESLSLGLICYVPIHTRNHSWEKMLAGHVSDNSYPEYMKGSHNTITKKPNNSRKWVKVWTSISWRLYGQPTNTWKDA